MVGCHSAKRKFQKYSLKISPSYPLGIVVIVVTAVVLLLNLVQSAIAKTLSICPPDDLHIHVLAEIFISMHLTLQITAKEIVVGALVIVIAELVKFPVVVLLVSKPKISCIF